MRTSGPRLRLAASLVFLALLLTQGVPLMCDLARPFQPGAVSLSTRAQLKWLQSRVNDDAAAQAAVWPEGELFVWEFYALSLQNVWETTGSSADRDVMIRESRRALL